MTTTNTNTTNVPEFTGENQTENFVFDAAGNRLTSAHQALLMSLRERFRINTSGVIFFPDANAGEPWIPAAELMTIAQQTGRFQSFDEVFSGYEHSLNKLFIKAVLTDQNGVVYSRLGSASQAEADARRIDIETLAKQRAWKATLTLAGIDPFKSNSIHELDFRPVNDDGERQAAQLKLDQELRSRLIRHIQTIAFKIGLKRYDPLKKRVDNGAYLEFLIQHGMKPSTTEMTISELESCLELMRSAEAEANVALQAA